MNFKKQINDFNKYGWPGVRLKVKNRLISSFVKRKSKRLLFEAKLKNKKIILIINGAGKTVSEVHRVFHLQDKLKLLEIPYLTINNNIINRLSIKILKNFDLLYIHRSNTEGKLLNLIHEYHKQKKPIIYDIDDLIFDKDKINYLTFIKNEGNNYRRNCIKQSQQHLRIMKIVNLTVTPTNFLSNYINKKFKIPTNVLRNHLDQNSLEQGKIIYNNKNSFSNTVTIGYFPGTKTHQHDFETIEKILFNLLSKYPNLRLKIVGELTLKNISSKIKKQIIKEKKVPYKKIMKIYRNVDINLAPLEMKNDFSEGKSELKYFFAGACGIPTIASATDAFKYAIVNNKNGYLCNNSKDWKKYLIELIENKNKRINVGKASFKEVHLRYTPTYQSKQLKIILDKLKFN